MDLIDRQEAIKALEKAGEINYIATGDFHGIINALNVIKGLPNAYPTLTQHSPKWIPCSEKLPEPRADVWTCSDIGQIQGYYEENVGVWYASFGQGRDYLELYVTAWMPLPKPYGGETDA